MSFEIWPRRASPIPVAFLLGVMLGACFDARTPTEIAPDRRSISGATAGGFTTHFAVPATSAPPPTIGGYFGVNLLPTPVTIAPGKYRINVQVRGYVHVVLSNVRGSATVQAGPGGVPGYLRGVDYPWRTLVTQVAIVPPAYVTRDPLKSSSAWQRIPLVPDPNYPDSSVYVGETVVQLEVPYVVVLDRYGAEFTEVGHRMQMHNIENMISNQHLTVTVTPISADPPPQAGVACRSASGTAAISRGSEVLCSATGFPTGTGLDWKFTDETNPGATVTESRESAEWKGRMVLSGVVSVQQRGGTLTALTRVVVSARTWPKFRIRGVNNGHGGETTEPWKQDDQPQRVGHLGHAHHPEMPTTLDAEQIPDGPNRGFWYLRSFPAELVSVIHMSRAWKPGHPFREMQKYGAVLDSAGNAVLDVAGTPTVYCRKHQLSAMEQLGLRHELEHVRQMDDFWRAHSPIAELESAVRAPDQLGASPFASYVRDQMYLKPNAALNQGDRRWEHVPEGKVPLVNFPCKLRYYP